MNLRLKLIKIDNRNAIFLIVFKDYDVFVSSLVMDEANYFSKKGQNITLIILFHCDSLTNDSTHGSSFSLTWHKINITDANVAFCLAHAYLDSVSAVLKT